MPNNKPNELLQYAGMATQIFAMLGVAVFIGIKADNYLNTSPLLVALLPLLILLGIFYKIFKESSRKTK
jgi:membrane associated rhomboid family serine protease